ncbi:MAG: hypothetical protein HLUCCO06_16260 [Halomonas sp. HL-93]|nr:MAG: hypothetical protein HLUCCO06_16260 [Halomonas sp. HL-93]
MMRWIITILASGPARKALGLVLAVLTIALFLLNLRRAGERAGRLLAASAARFRLIRRRVPFRLISAVLLMCVIECPDPRRQK